MDTGLERTTIIKIDESRVEATGDLPPARVRTSRARVNGVDRLLQPCPLIPRNVRGFMKLLSSWFLASTGLALDSLFETLHFLQCVRGRVTLTIAFSRTSQARIPIGPHTRMVNCLSCRRLRAPTAQAASSAVATPGYVPEVHRFCCVWLSSLPIANPLHI